MKGSVDLRRRTTSESVSSRLMKGLRDKVYHVLFTFLLLLLFLLSQTRTNKSTGFIP